MGRVAQVYVTKVCTKYCATFFDGHIFYLYVFTVEYSTGTVCAKLLGARWKIQDGRHVKSGHLIGILVRDASGRLAARQHSRRQSDRINWHRCALLYWALL